jgi:hypothetical protein
MAEEEKKTPKVEEKEPTMKLSDVKKLLAEMEERIKSKDEPVKLKRTQEHQAHLWRLNGKWVVDFVNQNNDPYIKHPIHAFNKWSDALRQNVAHIELKYHDDTTEVIPLTSYVENRVPVYCKILKRDKKDVSISHGTVEVQEWKGDVKRGTGKVIDQEIEMYVETFTLQTPEGGELVVPEHAIA